MHGPPGPPLGFAEFAAVLRRANANFYRDEDDDDSNDGREVEGVRAKSEPSEVEDEEEKLCEEEGIESPHTDPSAMTAEDSDQEEDYGTPPHGDKQDQNPFAHWESNN